MLCKFTMMCRRTKTIIFVHDISDNLAIYPTKNCIQKRQNVIVVVTGIKHPCFVLARDNKLTVKKDISENILLVLP